MVISSRKLAKNTIVASRIEEPSKTSRHLNGFVPLNLLVFYSRERAPPLAPARCPALGTCTAPTLDTCSVSNPDAPFQCLHTFHASPLKPPPPKKKKKEKGPTPGLEWSRVYSPQPPQPRCPPALQSFDRTLALSLARSHRGLRFAKDFRAPSAGTCARVAGAKADDDRFVFWRLQQGVLSLCYVKL